MQQFVAVARLDNAKLKTVLCHDVCAAVDALCHH